MDHTEYDELVDGEPGLFVKLMLDHCNGGNAASILRFKVKRRMVLGHGKEKEMELSTSTRA